MNFPRSTLTATRIAWSGEIEAGWVSFVRSGRETRIPEFGKVPDRQWSEEKVYFERAPTDIRIN